ncbi:MAG TPA: hypothetical protein VGH80_07535 [Xanthomonadaceae bacterium]|jgi:hypothetical protein
MTTPVVRVAILVGLPSTVLQRLQSRFKETVRISSIALARDGGLELEPLPVIAGHMVEQFADTASGYEHVLVVTLPYHSRVNAVDETVSLVQEMGAHASTMPPGDAKWPRLEKGRGMDNDFQRQLIECVSGCIDRCFPPERADDAELEAIKFEILRGLATHRKMGPNNHSHEDDLWKSRAQGLGPRDRDAIVRALMTAGLLGRKKNKSVGGTGWVYWIADVAAACAAYPELTKWT